MRVCGSEPDKGTKAERGVYVVKIQSLTPSLKFGLADAGKRR